jgi:hypothetical protein
MPAFGHQFMSRTVETHQRGVAIWYFKVDGGLVAGGAATTNGLLIGSQHGTITENGPGDYTITLNIPGQSFYSAQATSLTADANCTAEVLVDGTSITVKQTDLAVPGALADADFWLALHTSYAPDAT